MPPPRASSAIPRISGEPRPGGHTVRLGVESLDLVVLIQDFHSGPVAINVAKSAVPPDSITFVLELVQIARPTTGFRGQFHGTYSANGLLFTTRGEVHGVERLPNIEISPRGLWHWLEFAALRGWEARSPHRRGEGWSLCGGTRHRCCISA
ncbi:hypothetical protein NL676_033290 [Syzygium grande]|nr:hypothetical protein NL676_033290 [Syzygium grande]